jgi:hypothetical protein
MTTCSRAAQGTGFCRSRGRLVLCSWAAHTQCDSVQVIFSSSDFVSGRENMLTSVHLHFMQVSAVSSTKKFFRARFSHERPPAQDCSGSAT